MDALLASAGPVRQRKPRPHGSIAQPKTSDTTHKTVSRGPHKESIDPSTHSILTTTRLPSSFHHSNLATGSSSAPIRPRPSISRINDKKLRAKVARTDVSSKRARLEREEVNEWLNAPIAGGAGGIEVDVDGGERTWRVGQDEIVREVGVASGGKRFDLMMEAMGNYQVSYTRNGRYVFITLLFSEAQSSQFRHLAIASSLGHVATFDWHAGKLHSEIQLRESVRDIKWVALIFLACTAATEDSADSSILRRFTLSHRKNMSSYMIRMVSKYSEYCQRSTAIKRCSRRSEQLS